MAERDWRRDQERSRQWEQEDDRRGRGRGPQRTERFSDSPYGDEPSRGRGRYGSDDEGSDSERSYRPESEGYDQGSRSWERPTRRRPDEPYRASGNFGQSADSRRGQNEDAEYGWWPQRNDESRRYASDHYRGNRNREGGDVSWSYYEFWAIPGPYSGRGPSGYKRNAERIKEDVCDRLESHGEIDADQIQVEANEEGEVTLTGTVKSRREKRLADDVAESVRGVKDVHNQLKVKKEEPATAFAAGSDTSRSGRTGRDKV